MLFQCKSRKRFLSFVEGERGGEGCTRFANGKLEMLGTQDGLARDDAREFFEESSGNIWMGTISGLQRLHDGAFVSYTERDGLPAGHAQCGAIFE